MSKSKESRDAQQVAEQAEWKPHPACNLIPRMTEAEFEELKASIAKHGQQEWVTIDDTVDGVYIIDGYHRWRACQELGISCNAMNFESVSSDSIIEFVLLMNRHRRHLSQGQLAILAVQAEDFTKNNYVQDPKGSKVATLPAPPPPPKTRDQLAESVGVSSRLIGDAKKVAHEAPELAEEVKAGKITVNEAKRQMKATPPTKGGGPPPLVKPGVDAIAKAPHFTELANKIHAIKREVLLLADEPVGRELRGQQVEAWFQNIATALNHSKPHALCTCDGKPNCKVCKGMGWVTKEQSERQKETTR